MGSTEPICASQTLQGMPDLVAFQAAICYLSACVKQLGLQAVNRECMQADKLLLAEMGCSVVS